MTTRFNLHQNKILFDFIAHKYFGLNLSDKQDFIKELKAQIKPREQDIFSYQNAKIPNLENYNTHIQEYFELINKNLENDIYPTYYQYLALLFTEIFLDNYFNDKENFLNEFLNFVNDNKHLYVNFSNKTKEEIEEILFEKYITYKDVKKQEKTIKADVLNKLVYWMATWSWKTIITAINLLQFLKYNLKIDNIILITPNETISNQHENFLKNTWIADYVGNKYNKKIRIFEITKLKEEWYTTKEKKDDGSFDAITEFKDTNNLVLVDEWHKSIKSNWWWTQKQIRDAIWLKKWSFSFEYSATFWQAVNTNKDKNLQNEYSLWLLFDYSFRYFYEDKYWKRIQIENQKTKEKNQDDYLDNTLRLLLTYTQQKKFYEENPKDVTEYNIENPLITIFWHTVKSKKDEFGEEDPSDVYSFLQALWKIVKFNNKIKNKIEEIIKENNNYELLREYDENERIDKIIQDIKKYVFLSDPKQNLKTIYVNEIKSTPWEIGLKLWENGKYFGLISVWNIQDILKKVEQDKDNLITEKDVETSSLFEKINNWDLSMIVGSRKFTTWWNNYRISTMWLLNIGQGEWTMIIQILWRWVRLKWKKLDNGKYSMKREENWGKVLIYWQTLNILGLNSKYLEDFIKSIEKEDGINLGGKNVSVTIPTSLNYENVDLKIIQTKHNFYKEFLLHPLHLGENYNLNYQKNEDGKIKFSRKIKIDKRKSTTSWKDWKKIVQKEDWYEFTQKVYEEIKPYLNKQKIYFKLNEFLQSKPNLIYTNWIEGLDNLIENILENNAEIYLNSKNDIKNIKKIENLIIELLEKYVNYYYKYTKLWFENYNQEVVDLDIKNNENIPKHFKILIKNTTYTPEELKNKINKVISQIWEEVEKCEPTELCLLNLKQHIFYPLIYIRNNDVVEVLEWGYLVKSEEKFIKNLKDYISTKPENLNWKTIFLLRNNPKKWIWFHLSATGFYPDFIIWIKDEEKQYIIFIDPHWIKHEEINWDKLNAWKIIKNIPIDNEKIKLNAFIVTDTKLKDVKDKLKYPDEAKKQFKENYHVLFTENDDYMKDLFDMILNESSKTSKYKSSKSYTWLRA